MAVEADGDQMILISADLTQIDAPILAIVRKKFAELTNEVDPMKIMIACTHTHTSHTLGTSDDEATFKSIRNLLNEFLPDDVEYKDLVKADDSVITPIEATEFVTTAIASAAKKAWDNRKPAYFTNEFGRAAVGMCRRVHYDDGTSQMWGDTNTANFDCLEGGNDSGVELLYTFDENKKLTGVVANIACPAQILEQRSFISADYWGRAKANLRAKLGDDIYLLGLCGAAGDQCPRDLVRWVEPETPIDDPNVKRPNVIEHKADPSMYDISGCNRVGKRVANEIISVYEEVTDMTDEAVFAHKVINVDLPLRKVTITEYNNALREIDYYISKNLGKGDFNFEDKARLHVHLGTVERYRHQQETEVFTCEYHVIRFGDVAIVTNPFELFLDFGNRIKARSLAKQTFIAQLCNGCDGYVPTKKAQEAGHYSAYVSSGNIGFDGGDVFTRNTIHEINELFK